MSKVPSLKEEMKRYEYKGKNMPERTFDVEINGERKTLTESQIVEEMNKGFEVKMNGEIKKLTIGQFIKEFEEEKYEGRQELIRDLKMPDIETFENMYPESVYEVVIKTGKGELSSVCPKTGLPDFATMTITYSPRNKCIELKSLKEYITAYRDVGIFHEFLANKILEDLVVAIQPHGMWVHIEMNPRGNITTFVNASYPEGNEHLEVSSKGVEEQEI